MEYPYINSLNTRVISRKKINDQFHLEFEQTIFFPGTKEVLADTGFVNNLEIQKIYEENNKIYHIVSDNLTGPVQLSLNWEGRIQRMQDHTSLLILTHYLKEFYDLERINYNISDHCFISVKKKGRYDFDCIKQRIVTLVNDYILSALPIKSYFEELTRKEDNRTFQVRKHHIKLTNLSNFPCQDGLLQNSSEIRGFSIIDINCYGDEIRLEFISGNRLFSLWSKIISELKGEQIGTEVFQKIIDENKILSKENLTLKAYIINTLLAENNINDLNLENTPISPSDLMIIKPNFKVFAYRHIDDQIYFYSNTPNYLSEKYPDCEIDILDNEFNNIYGIIKK